MRELLDRVLTHGFGQLIPQLLAGLGQVLDGQSRASTMARARSKSVTEPMHSRRPLLHDAESLDADPSEVHSAGISERD